MEEELIPSEPEKKEEIKKIDWTPFFREVIGLIKDLIIIVAIVVFIRSFIMLPFQIKGPSMLDSYYDKEFIIVDRFSYLDIPFIKIGVPQRGDVIVFRPHVSQDKEYFIKRIIWLPGDTIKIEWGNVFLLNKTTHQYTQLDEKYLSKANSGQTYVSWLDDTHIYQVPEWEYFVMGDNRLASTDGRTCFSSCMIEGRKNYIPKDFIVGRVWLDLGYFNIMKFNFIHPELWIDTIPKFFSSPKNYNYNLK